jgi:O-antigen ligase
VILFLGRGSWPVKLGVVTCLAMLAVLISIVRVDIPELFDPFLGRLGTTTVSLDDDAAADRKWLWDSAWEEFLESPVVGVGRGNFRLLDESDVTKTGQIHNTYLGILCEIGISGFLVLTAFLLYYPLKLTRWRTGNPAMRAPTNLLLLSFLGTGLCGLTICIENYRGLWVLIAMAEAYERLYLRPAYERSGRGAGL